MVRPTWTGDLDDETERIARQVLDAAFRVHRNLGPGLLERAYLNALAFELAREELEYDTEVPVPFRYAGIELEGPAYRLDVLVEDRVVLELKAIEELLPVHTSQVVTYLRISERRLGLLLNFGARRLSEGLRRIVL